MRTLLRGASILALVTGALSPTAPAQQQPQPQPQPQPPSVLVWMMDDVGFAQVSAFGGLVETPNIDRVAQMGLSYINYHTAPICSAARAAFLSGRMPHSVHIGGHATAARALPGYDAHIPASAGSIAANLHAAGYVTAAFGKWDHLPNEEASPAGPFNQWALGQGFDHFYGFLAADADNWNPILIRDLSPVAKPANPAYHLSADLADQAIAMIQSRAARNPQRPFFIYWATGAAHAPHHAPRNWIEHYRGKFDMGWDQAREVIFRQQKAHGLVGKDALLAPRPEGMPPWNSLTADQQRLYARQMETFAAALSFADAQFGRILDALKMSGQLDNTLVVVTSDNGASAEGGPDGLYVEAEVTSAKPPGMAGNLPFYDRWGGPQTYPHYALGWAVAGDTPYRYYKQMTHEGGTRVPLVIAWPRGIAARGELRGQFLHVSDIAPTILAAAGVSAAATINNVPQSPMEGQNVAATFAGNSAPGHQGAQYVELYGNKGLWLDDWSIVTTHRTRMWDFATARTFDEPWELYDLRNDPGQTHDLAARYPERIANMSRQFEEQAQRYHVYPQHNLSDTLVENAAKSRADFERRGGQWHYAGPIGNIPAALAPPITARSFIMTAALELAQPGITGPLFAFGGQMGGMGFYLSNGKPVLILNTLKGATAQVVAREALGAGKHAVELDFIREPAAPDGSTEYQVRIKSNGRVLAEQTLRFAIPGFFGISETFGVGTDDGSPVLAGYAAGAPFPGRVSDVEFDFMRPAPGT